MAKKSSRSARTQQNTNTQKRSIAAQPLVPTESAPVKDPLTYSYTSRSSVGATPENTNTLMVEPEVPENTVTDVTKKAVTPVKNIAAATPVAPKEVAARSPITSSSGKPLPRRYINPAAPKQTGISREEEFRFIASDLRLVFILTVLMVVVLIVLTFVLGR